MKNVLYEFAKYFKIVPLKTLINLTGQKSIFPFYHVISDEDVIHIKHLFRVRSIKEFIRDLDYFMQNFNPLDPKELIANINSGIVSKKPSFLLTFDDGLRQFYDIIAPILLQKGIPAICFLNSDFIDNKDLFYRYKTSILIERLITIPISENLRTRIKLFVSKRGIQFDEEFKFLLSIKYSERQWLDELAIILEVDFQEYLRNYKPFMDKEQIKYLVKQGFLFGSHSIDHPLYSDLHQNQQIIQTVQSIIEITSLFDLDYKLFSFPFTDIGVSKQFFDIIYADNQKNVDLTFGSSGLMTDIRAENIQRIPIEIESFSAKEIIYGEYWFRLINMLLNRNIIKRF